MSASVIILVADGARADALCAATTTAEFPALARLRAEGGLHTITTVFPSVTGPAYAPFLTGRFPGPIGLPGLRWYDRARTRCTLPPYCRSYLGKEMRHMDGDLAAGTPTLLEMVRSRFIAMSMIGRGARRRDQIGRDVRLLARIAATHVRGDVRGWLALDRVVARRIAGRVRSKRPELTFAALLGLDKTSHATGHTSPGAREALRAVDGLVAELRADAERAGRWESTHIWVVSDHGHSPVTSHDDLAGAVQASGARTIAHPWVFARRPDAAVMVSGNAMAHVYLELARRDRPWWPELAGRWEPLVDALLERPSVDLAILPIAPGVSEVRAPGRGRARIAHAGGRYAYRPVDGDPLGLGALEDVDAEEAHDAASVTDYPDAVVQIAHLADASRAGEIILSAAPGWDFRAKYEPIPHVSTHGALHREHMLVPLLVSHPVRGTPRRTVDVMPSVLRVLGHTVPDGLDGRAFV